MNIFFLLHILSLQDSDTEEIEFSRTKVSATIPSTVKYLTVVGNGVILPAGDQLELNTITVDGVVNATSLSVTEKITLKGAGTILRPVQEDQIRLTDNVTINLVCDSDDSSCPTLSLGLVGNVTVVPKLTLSIQGVSRAPHILVEASNLSNCEDWANALEVSNIDSSKVMSSCEITSSTLDANTKAALIIRKNSLSMDTAIIGVAMLVWMGIQALLAGLIVKCRNKSDDKNKKDRRESDSDSL